MVITFIFIFITNQFTSFHWLTAILAGVFFILITVWLFLEMLKTRKAFEPSKKVFFAGRTYLDLHNRVLSLKGKVIEEIIPGK